MSDLIHYFLMGLLCVVAAIVVGAVVFTAAFVLLEYVPYGAAIFGFIMGIALLTALGKFIDYTSE